MTAVEIGQPIVDVSKPDEGDQRMWSVTTIIGVLDKPALVYWSAEQTALAAIKSVEAWQAIEEASGTEEAVRWLTGARFRRPKGERGAAELGTAVHAACEQYALSGQRPDVDAELAPYLDQFDEWLQRFSPDYQATEVTVYSPEYGYAGTCDGFLTVDGVRLIIDYKTSKKSVDKKGNPTHPYPEVALQLAAYRYAELAAVWKPRRFESFRRRYYLLSATEQTNAVPVPEVDGGGVIHLTPEHCELYPVRCDKRVHDAFLYALECARWVFQDAKSAIGNPMTPPKALGPEVVERSKALAHELEG